MFLLFGFNTGNHKEKGQRGSVRALIIRTRVWGPTNYDEDDEPPKIVMKGLRARQWHLSQRRLLVTGRENVPANQRGRVHWVVETAGSPHEEFLGPP